MGKAARDASRKHGEGWGREASHSSSERLEGTG